MSAKTSENIPEQEEAKSVPLRRSLRLSSCSPTPSRVLTRSSTSEGSPHPSKLSKKRRLSGELSPKRDKTPATRRSTRNISSIPEEVSEIEYRTPVKNKLTEVTSPQKENVNDNLENDNTKRTQNKNLSSEFKESKTTRITRSKSNQIIDKEITIETSKGEMKKPVVLLEPIIEICDDVTSLSLTDSKYQADNKEDNIDSEQDNQKNQENIEEGDGCLKGKEEEEGIILKEKSPLEQLDDSKSNSDSFTAALDTATATVDILNQSCDSNTPSDQSVSCGSSVDISEERKDSQSTESESLKIDVEKSEHSTIIANNDEELKSSFSVSSRGSEENDVSKSANEGDIDFKIDNLLEEHDFSNSEDEEEEEQHPLIDGMAEEGEEDTPSEGSNDIMEVGEEINTTESEYSTDESYDKNSFIDDEEEVQLLSGEEFDLSLNSPKRKSRIIQLSSGSDEEIIKINRVKKEKPKKRKKSRIMKFSDSSEEETFDDIKERDDDDESKNQHEAVPQNGEENEKNMRSQKNEVRLNSPIIQENNETEELDTSTESCTVEIITKESTLLETVQKERCTEGKDLESNKDSTMANEETNKNMESVEKGTNENKKMGEVKPVLTKGNVDEFLESFKDEIQSEHEVVNAVSSLKDIKSYAVISGETEEIILETESHPRNKNIESNEEMKNYTSSTPNKDHINDRFNENKETIQNEEADTNKNNISFNASISYISENDTETKKSKKKIVVIENIRVQDIKDKSLSDQINEVIDAWSSGINSASDVSINLSLNYVDKSIDSEKPAENQKDGMENLLTRVNKNETNAEKAVEESIVKKKKKRRKNKKRKASLNLSEEESVDVNDKTKAEIITVERPKKKKKKQTLHNLNKKQSEEENVNACDERKIGIIGVERPKKKRKETLHNLNKRQSEEENVNMHDEREIQIISDEKPKKKKKQVLQNRDKKENNFNVLHAKEHENNETGSQMKENLTKKKRRKRKYPKNEIVPSTIDEISDNESSPIKRKKQKMLKDNRFNGNIKSINIVDEAVRDDKKSKLILLTPDLSETSEWNVKKHKIKPSLQSMQNIEMQRKTIKCSTSEGTKKFHVKDFKNLMFFDPARVRRVDTKQVIKKKMF